MSIFMRKLSGALTLLAAIVVLNACESPSSSDGQGQAQGQGQGEVVIYASLDREFSEPILKAFEAETGIRVRAVYDTEAVKTVGLVNRLIAERQRPQADIFWNNEIVRSIQLKSEGLTEAYTVPNAAGIPDAFKDPEGHWVGFAARARVLMTNTNLLPPDGEQPTRVRDLADPKWKGKAAFGKPLFGTTSTHFAVHYAQLGPDQALALWRGIFENSVMVAGNAQSRDAAANGELAFCFTDTDDAVGAMNDGKPVRIIYTEDELLLIPNTLVKIKDGPNSENALRLIDHLLSAEVETALSLSRSAQIPLRPGLDPPPALEPIPDGMITEVDWTEVAEILFDANTAIANLVTEFE
jgi:iron(III) transport system substrate-binding protein